MFTGSPSLGSQGIRTREAPPRRSARHGQVRQPETGNTPKAPQAHPTFERSVSDETQIAVLFPRAALCEATHLAYERFRFSA